MLRAETKVRARALQLLYAWETQGEPGVAGVANGLARLTGPEPELFDRAEALAQAIVGEADALDREVGNAADNWRVERIGVVERNILRLAIHELKAQTAPPKVIIDEAMWLAHRFGGVKSPPFINGVLDRVAHSLGRL